MACAHLPSVTCANCAPLIHTPPPFAPTSPPTQQGWVCPVCGNALAPWMPTCQHGTTWTSTTPTINVTFHSDPEQTIVTDTGDVSDHQAGELH